jgi:hypothetical protein
MFDKVKQIWSDWGFEIVVIMSIFTIIVTALFRIGKKGSWSQSYHFENSNHETPVLRPSQSSTVRESKGEAECRRVLQKLLNKPFVSVRPDFLRNPVTGGVHNLEIDCYNKDLKLGVEYNGVQHYQYKPFFHKNKETFRNQMYRDEMKRVKCRENNVRLIEVPYTVKLENIEYYLSRELQKYGYI